jgi:hypothetical protein
LTMNTPSIQTSSGNAAPEHGGGHVCVFGPLPRRGGVVAAPRQVGHGHCLIAGYSFGVWDRFKSGFLQ